MPDNEMKFTGGGTSSKGLRFDLIPFVALVRMARSFLLGIENRPDGSSWNALSSNFRSCLEDKAFVVNRAAHAAEHAMKLKAILNGEIPDDGDDHAGALLWSGAFLACVTEPRKNCSGCGGTGQGISGFTPSGEATHGICRLCGGSGRGRP